MKLRTALSIQIDEQTSIYSRQNHEGQVILRLGGVLTIVCERAQAGEIAEALSKAREGKTVEIRMT